MPARIVVVHDDPSFHECVPALQAAGYDAMSFTSSMEALDALEAAERTELLITGMSFPRGMPNGVSIARMARIKLRGVRVLFVAQEQNRQHAAGLGEFLAAPVNVAEIVETVRRMLAEGDG